jgi:hypothetical protein
MSMPVYTNAFLATLNARKAMSGAPTENSHMMVSMPSTLLNSVNGVNSKSQKSSQGISIRIDTTTQEYPENVRQVNLYPLKHLLNLFSSVKTQVGQGQEDLGEKDAVIDGDDYVCPTSSPLPINLLLSITTEYIDGKHETASVTVDGQQRLLCRIAAAHPFLAISPAYTNVHTM